MHKATANGGDNKCMHIYEVLKAVGFGNMRPGLLVTLTHLSRWCLVEWNIVKINSTAERAYTVRSRIDKISDLGYNYTQLSRNWN